MSASPSTLDDLSRQAEDTANDEKLTPQEKEARLAYLHGQMLTEIGRVETYMNDAKLAEQASDIERYKALLHVREGADYRAELLRRGLATIEECDAAGLTPHEELDRLGEEGLLQEFSLHAWRSELHPRTRGGQWADVFKSVAPKGRHGKKQPSALHAPKDKGPRADVTPKELGIEPPPLPSLPSPEHAHKEASLLPHEQGRLDAERFASMSNEDRLADYRSKASAFDKKVTELASTRLTAAFAKLGKKDPGTVVVHPEDVDKFLGSAPYGKVLYHGTPRGNLDSILSSGLHGGDTHMDIKGRETVFLTSSPDAAKMHGTPVPVATKLDNPLILEPGEDANDAMKRAGVTNLDSFDGMVRKGADGVDVVTSWEPKDDLKVVTDEPVIDPRTLDKAELKFNAAGSVNQHTLGEFAREAAGEPDTVDLHSTTDAQGNRVYSADRQALHKEIVSRFLRQHSWDETAGKIDKETGKPEGDWVFCDTCPELEGSAHPEVLFSGGGYSAGKGTVAKKLIAQIDSGYDGPALNLDPDVIKAMLPEFQARYEHDPLANAIAYREAWDIAQEIQRQAQERKLSIVVDGISDTSPEEMIKRITSFTDKGYSARAVYVDIPTEEALKRAKKRAEDPNSDKKDRRHIPETIMRAVHRDVAATIPALARRVEKEHIPVDIEVHDNNQEPDPGEKFGKPKVYYTYSHKEGKSVVHDESLWSALRKKSREKLPEEKQALGESIYREVEHPRGRGGRWIEVLRDTNFPGLPHVEDHAERRRQLAGALYQRAVAAEPKVSDVLRKVTTETGGRLEGFAYRLKTRDSIVGKLERWQRESQAHGDKDVTPDTVARRIGDTLRYTAVFDEPHYVSGVKSVVDGLSSLGYRKVDFGNYWHPEEDYSGINAQFVGPDGQPVELQFHTPISHHVKEHVNWPLYNEYRQADGEKRLGLWNQMVENGRQVAIPPGVETLGPLMARSPYEQHHTEVH